MEKSWVFKNSFPKPILIISFLQLFCKVRAPKILLFWTASNLSIFFFIIPSGQGTNILELFSSSPDRRRRNHVNKQFSIHRRQRPQIVLVFVPGLDDVLDKMVGKLDLHAALLTNTSKPIDEYMLDQVAFCLVVVREIVDRRRRLQDATRSVTGQTTSWSMSRWACCHFLEFFRYSRFMPSVSRRCWPIFPAKSKVIFPRNSCLFNLNFPVLKNSYKYRQNCGFVFLLVLDPISSRKMTTSSCGSTAARKS